MSLSLAELQIEEALKAYFGAIQAQKTAPNPPPLRPYFEKLDSLSAQFGKELDPSLKHYMERKSYEKALQFLQDKN